MFDWSVLITLPEGHPWTASIRFRICTLLMSLHNWVSAFWHPVCQSGAGAFQYQTGFPYSGTGLVSASQFLFTPVSD
jgi:hypothetical protein